MKYSSLSIVIPVYNEEKFILTTLNTVIASDTLGLAKEIVVVDDGSSDKTVEILRRFENDFAQKKNNKITIKLIMNKKNAGKGSALKDGFIKTTGDIVLVQDADLEYDPTDYPLLLEPFMKDSADVVYGSRFISDRPHRTLYFWNYVANSILTTMSNVFTNLNITDMETGYKVFRGDIIREIAPRLESKRFGFEPEITARIAKIKGISVYEVGISYRGRTYEDGKKIGWKDGVIAVWEILKYNLFSK